MLDGDLFNERPVKRVKMYMEFDVFADGRMEQVVQKCWSDGTVRTKKPEQQFDKVLMSEHDGSVEL